MTQVLEQPTTSYFSAIASVGPLASAVAMCASVANGRIKAALGAVEMVSSDKIVVYSTSLELSVQIEVALCQIESAGRIAVDASMLLKLLNQIKDETVRMTADGDSLIIRGSAREIKLPLIVDELPRPPQVDDFPSVKLPTADFIRAVHSVEHSAAKLPTRYAFNGILIQRRKKVLDVVATDGHTLSIASLAVPNGKDFSAILPRSTVNLICKLPSDEDDSLMISVSENQVFFECDSIKVTSNLIEGIFPPYEDVIPKNPIITCEAGREDLLAEINATAMTADEVTPAIVLSLTKKSGISMSCWSKSGESKSSFACKVDGDLETGFNPGLLIQCLRASDDDTAKIGFSAPNKPALIHFSKSKHVVMPANIPNR